LFDRPEFETVLWKNHISLSTAIEQAYHHRHIDIKELLQTARSKVYLSDDIWTSDYGLSLLGVVSHFIDRNDKQKVVLIGLPRLYDKHCGVNIAHCLIKAIKPYTLSAEQLGLFMTDNAGNIDTMMEELEKQVVGLKATSHGYCIGHIINLVTLRRMKSWW